MEAVAAGVQSGRDDSKRSGPGVAGKLIKQGLGWWNVTFDDTVLRQNFPGAASSRSSFAHSTRNDGCYHCTTALGATREMEQITVEEQPRQLAGGLLF